MSKRDLFVVVADLDAENTIKTLLVDRQPALGINLAFSPERPPNGDLLRWKGRDSGCHKDAIDLLRRPQCTHRHGLLIFDHHGCGAERKSRVDVERNLEVKLHANGWAVGDVAVIVIEPELEAWVWSSSPRVADLLGWQDDRDRLRPFLAEANLWSAESLKPIDPKKAMATALKEKQKPLGARLFSDLASRVAVAQCQDAAFRKFNETLKRWFGGHGESE